MSVSRLILQYVLFLTCLFVSSTGEKPFRCDSCNKSFSSRSGLIHRRDACHPDNTMFACSSDIDPHATREQSMGSESSSSNESFNSFYYPFEPASPASSTSTEGESYNWITTSSFDSQSQLSMCLAFLLKLAYFCLTFHSLQLSNDN